MVFYSKVASCALFLVAGVIDVQYSLWIGLWCVIGSTCGLLSLNFIMRKMNR